MDEYISKKDIIRHLCLTTGCSYHDVVIGTIMKFPVADVRPLTDKEAKIYDDTLTGESTDPEDLLLQAFSRLAIMLGNIYLTEDNIRYHFDYQGKHYDLEIKVSKAKE